MSEFIYNLARGHMRSWTFEHGLTVMIVAVFF